MSLDYAKCVYVIHGNAMNVFVNYVQLVDLFLQTEHKHLKFRVSPIDILPNSNQLKYMVVE